MSKARNIANTDSFTVVTLTGGSKTATLSREFPPGTYSIESINTDNDLEIYLGSTAGTNVGYATGGAKAITASAAFKYVTTNNANSSDAIVFTFLSEAQNLVTKTDAYWAPPTITSISPSDLPIVNNTATITGSNFDTNVTVKFRKSDDSTLVDPKSTVRGSATSIIVTRPDTFATGDAPYDLIVTNPTSNLSGTLLNGVTAGSNPTWVTSATLNNPIKNVAFSQTIQATDPDGGAIAYSVISGSFPTGISLNGSTGVISGTTTDNAASYSVIIAATDTGGNSTNRTFTMQTLTVPNAPTIGTVTTLSATSVTVAFTPPTSNGNSAITSYTVTSSPGSITGTGSSSPITVSGLTAGTTYTFTVTATNAVGTSAASSASSSVVMPKATGGSIVRSGGYTYHVFTVSGSFTPVTASLSSVEVLNIAGGGAGGAGGGGGGAGAGGLVYSSSFSVSNGVGVTATVGAGAAGLASGGGTTAQNGSNSVFGSNTANGGGAGGARLGLADSTATGKNGGCGGAPSYNNPSVVGTGSQGFNGGTGTDGNEAYQGGGGGGTGAAGGNANPNVKGQNAGGAGTISYSAWLSAIASVMTGVSGWSTATSSGRIGGGGGGGGLSGYPNSSGGAGGAGGGAAGGNLNGPSSTIGQNATANTGGGGGGSGDSPTSGGGSGGSGIIIVRYT